MSFLAAFFSVVILSIPMFSMIYFGLYLAEFSSLNKTAVYIIGNASGLISVAYVALMNEFRKLYLSKGGSNERRNKSRQL